MVRTEINIDIDATQSEYSCWEQLNKAMEFLKQFPLRKQPWYKRLFKNIKLMFKLNK